MPGSDRNHGTKRKTDASGGVSHQTQGPARTFEGDLSKDGKVQLKSLMSSSSKRKRHKLSKYIRESSAGPDDFLFGDTVPPGVNTVKPLVEYDDISSDSDTFSDPPSSRPSERGAADRLDPSPDYDREDVGREADGNRERRQPRKKPKDPSKVRDSGNGEPGPKKKSSKDREKGRSVKSKEKSAPVGASAKQPERGEPVLSNAQSVGSATSSASSCRSKESSRSGKSHKDRQQRREGRGEVSRTSSHRSRADRTHRKSSKSHKSSPRGKSSNRGSPRRKGSALSPSPRRKAGSESPLGYGQQSDDGYNRRRVAQQSSSPYGDTSRRSRHRSSSFERDSSPYSRRRSISPYTTRRSSSTSPVSR